MRPQGGERLRVLDNPLTAFNLRVLCTLIEEGNVTNAARRLNLSQPATSLILKQLRDIFRDELLVRSGGRMVPTDHAQALYRTAQHVLSELNELILRPEEFEPQTFDQTMTIGVAETVSPGLLGTVLRQASLQAPAARFVLQRLPADFDLEGAMANGAVDVAIGHWLQMPVGLKRTILAEEEVVWLVDRNHRFAHSSPSLEDLSGARHLMAPGGSAWLPSVLETAAGLQRTVRDQRIVLCDYLMAPHLLPGTDLVLTAGYGFATHHAGLLPLSVIKCPFPYPRSQLTMAWHERTDHSLAQKWVRGLLSAVPLYGVAPGSEQMRATA